MIESDECPYTIKVAIFNYNVSIVTDCATRWPDEKVKHICYFYKIFHFSERFYRLLEEI